MTRGEIIWYVVQVVFMVGATLSTAHLVATGVLRDARQQAVYLRYPNGYVEIVE